MLTLSEVLRLRHGKQPEDTGFLIVPACTFAAAAANRRSIARANGTLGPNQQCFAAPGCNVRSIEWESYLGVPVGSPAHTYRGILLRQG